MERFDVVVVGTGVSGQTAAEELGAAGLRVAVVDRREIGGTCSLRGCEPKKALYTAAEAVERTRDQAQGGLTGAVGLDWPKLVAFKRTFTDAASPAIEKALADSGATLLRGTARFVAEDAVEVSDARYAAEHFVLATGARPAPLGVPGEEHVLDSERFMAAERLGGRIVFVGGGYISFEFAHIAAAAGAVCTILHRGDRVLESFDPDLSGMLARGYRDDGIEVRTGVAVAGVRRVADGFEVVLGSGETLACDMVVHGAGRVPDLEALDLTAAGVVFGPKGIEVDASMRSTSNPRVFAVGDAAAAGAPLTPVGIAQARVARANILKAGSATFEPRAVPSVVFSHPPMASVGLTEAQARDRGIDVEVRLVDTSGWESSRRAGVRVSGAKTLVERGTGRILGAHLLGHSAEEVVNVFAAAMMGGLTAEDLKSAVWAYPTGGSEIVYLL